MDIDGDDDIGWGRPRPKFEDLLPSSPDQSDDDDVHFLDFWEVENNMVDVMGRKEVMNIVLVGDR